MECINHPATSVTDRCTACLEAFCDDCLVTIQGQKYCGACKVSAFGGALPVSEQVAETCWEATDALQYAIIGIFCFGFLLGPVAISKALKAKSGSRRTPI